jgi:hypothetical protein
LHDCRILIRRVSGHRQVFLGDITHTDAIAFPFAGKFDSNRAYGQRKPLLAGQIST